MPKLEAQGISMVFTARGRRVPALHDVDLRVEPGQFVSIVGPSGCGKTTFLRMAAGLITPTAGRILLDARVIQRPGPDRGFVFQTDGLLPWRTIIDNVGFGLQIQGKSRSARDATAQRLMDLVGLTGFEQNYPSELSGGMRQRANLARALAIDPEILLMDEPFAALDAQTREFMQSELLRIWAEHRKTVLFITHQIDEAIYLSDEVVVLSGRPGMVREVLPVPFPRPRELTVKRAPEFTAMIDHIWALLEEDIRVAAMGKVS
jgi:NitT/TauT family transport system ATP-binding protein